MSPTPPEKPDHDYLAGQLLVAMPSLTDLFFERAVVFLCSHAAEGAVGLVVNRPADSPRFGKILNDLDIEPTEAAERVQIHMGGPVELNRGYVLHTDDIEYENSQRVGASILLTSSVDVLREIAKGGGPRRSMVLFGYAGWGPGQLDQEIMQNSWLNVQADEDLVFSPNHSGKWERAIGGIGDTATGLPVDPYRISPTAGNA